MPYPILSVQFTGIGLRSVLRYPISQASAYIAASAVDAGVDTDLSYDLVAIFNALSALGQVVGGLLADRYGACRFSPMMHSLS